MRYVPKLLIPPSKDNKKVQYTIWNVLTLVKSQVYYHLKKGLNIETASKLVNSIVEFEKYVNFCPIGLLQKL